MTILKVTGEIYGPFVRTCEISSRLGNIPLAQAVEAGLAHQRKKPLIG